MAEKVHLTLVPNKAVKNLMTEDIEVIKKRFSRRMNGNLSLSVATMLERKHAVFDNVERDIHIHGSNYEYEDILKRIK